MLVHKLRMRMRTKGQREALETALETSRLLYNQHPRPGDRNSGGQSGLAAKP